MSDPSTAGRCPCGGVRFELSESATAADYCQIAPAASAAPGPHPRRKLVYAAVWEPIPNDGLERWDEAKPNF